MEERKKAGRFNSRSRGKQSAVEKADTQHGATVGTDAEVRSILHEEALLDEACFDERFYLECFPDVAEALRLNQIPNGYFHYAEYGYTEMMDGRRRSVSVALGAREPVDELTGRKAENRRLDELGDDFFEELYVECYPEIAQLIDRSETISTNDRWRLYRDAELKIGHAPTSRFGAGNQSLDSQRRKSRSADLEGFDSLAYLLLYPDVRDAMGGSPAGAKDHWLGHGFAEGRVGPGLPINARRYIEFSELFSRPLGLNVYGPFEATSGLGTAARAMAKAVKASGIPYDLWLFKDTGTSVLPAAHHTVRKPKYRANLILANAGVVQNVFDAYPSNHFGDAYNIVVWQWELASFRPDWIFETEGIDEIWTNSRFQVEAISSLVKCPVTNIPLPVSAPSASVPSLRAFYSIPDTAFVFLGIFDIGSTVERKNPLAVVDAFKKLTETHKNIHLVLKYHGESGSQNTLNDLRKAIRGLAYVTVISDKLNINGMDRLRATCDCLISAHRSEGFGLNIAEFMSLGKPVIATMYSGNVDFFDDRVGYPIDYRLVEVEATIGPYRKGAVWADPLPEAILTQMQNVLDNPEMRRLRSTAAAKRIKSTLSTDAVGNAISFRLKELDLAASAPMFLKNLGSTSTAIRRLIHRPLRDGTASVSLPYQPLMSFVVPVYNVPVRYLQACVESVIAQTYPFWELCLCDDGSTDVDTVAALEHLRGSDYRIKIVRMPKNSGISAATNRAVETATGPFVALLDNDDVLEKNALEEIVLALNKDPDLDVIYTDEDKIDQDGQRIEHFCKPDWSPEHLESVMYVLHMLTIRKSLFLKIGGARELYDGAQDYDLMLRLSRETDRIAHIDQKLYAWRAIPGSAAAKVDAKPNALVSGMAALDDHVKIKYGTHALVEPGLLAGTFRVRRRPVVHVGASLLILTGNRRMIHPEFGDTNLIEHFVNSIIERTDHPNYEIVIIDNSTLSRRQTKSFRALGARVENYDHPGEFNYSAKANFAIRSAHYENIVVLNDDMAIIRDDWLTSLLELSTDPEIGAVGARLLHADGSIQHIGVILGVNGGAVHPYHGYPRDFVGYNAFTHIIRNYSAVTGACLATRRSIVAEVGGFSESFATDYNDIDFCLKVRQAGYRVAYTSYAELFHFESASICRSEQDPLEVSRFKDRWGHVLIRDPHYNQNLTKSGLDFAEDRNRL